jgi:hypothetical protein
MSTRRTAARPGAHRSIGDAAGRARYRTDLIDGGEERELAARIPALPLKEFEFQGYPREAPRRLLRMAVQLRDALDRARLSRSRTSCSRCGSAPRPSRSFRRTPLEQVLVAEYSPGTPIGWHRDKPMFGDVVGVSLLSACTFRFRRRSGDSWERYSFSRRAALRVPAARARRERSGSTASPEVATLRYSVTFRTLRPRHEER